jgi:hypothetical protein
MVEGEEDRKNMFQEYAFNLRRALLFAGIHADLERFHSVRVHRNQ